MFTYPLNTNLKTFSLKRWRRYHLRLHPIHLHYRHPAMACKPTMLASKSMLCIPTCNLAPNFYEKIGCKKILERQKYHINETISIYDTLVWIRIKPNVGSLCINVFFLLFFHTPYDLQFTHLLLNLFNVSAMWKADITDEVESNVDFSFMHCMHAIIIIYVYALFVAIFFLFTF